MMKLRTIKLEITVRVPEEAPLDAADLQDSLMDILTDHASDAADHLPEGADLQEYLSRAVRVRSRA